jgi:hypothetical protein
VKSARSNVTIRGSHAASGNNDSLRHFGTSVGVLARSVSYVRRERHEPTVYATIHFDDRSIPPGHGQIEPGSGVGFTQKVEDISYIEYQIGERHYRMDEKLITKVARAGRRGVTSITLSECSPPNVPVSGNAKR